MNRTGWPWWQITSPSESVVGGFLTRRLSATWACCIYCPYHRACIFTYFNHVHFSTVTYQGKPLSACILTWNISKSKLFHFRHLQDHNAAFKSKTTMEVIRALVVFQLCGINKLVDNNEMVRFLKAVSKKDKSKEERRGKFNLYECWQLSNYN